MCGIFTVNNLMLRAHTRTLTLFFNFDYEYEYENRPSKTGLSTKNSLEAFDPSVREYVPIIPAAPPFQTLLERRLQSFGGQVHRPVKILYQKPL